MEEIKYLKVCTNCETPEQYKPKTFILIRFMNLISIILLFLFAFVIAGSIAILFFIIYEVIRKFNSNKCKSCNHQTLVHVSSPIGLKIMEKNGWQPLN